MRNCRVKTETSADSYFSPQLLAESRGRVHLEFPGASLHHHHGKQIVGTVFQGRNKETPGGLGSASGSGRAEVTYSSQTFSFLIPGS